MLQQPQHREFHNKEKLERRETEPGKRGQRQQRQKDLPLLQKFHKDHYRQKSEHEIWQQRRGELSREVEIYAQNNRQTEEEYWRCENNWKEGLLCKEE